ncbi:hypothetical protein [Thalassospira sp.]|uniref:hypothetical protein n=1 Tax=Thalassospira sp. TaxID=1912094 RepID=UPI002734B72F|nr:hypothetical protein [Thalassospira sp.]MDP2699409.1 hypothetical protein [Thalassospira sp.]
MNKLPDPDMPVAEGHDQWFRKQVADAVREADNPGTEWVSHDTILQDIADQRAALQARLKGHAG